MWCTKWGHEQQDNMPLLSERIHNTPQNTALYVILHWTFNSWYMTRARALHIMRQSLLHLHPATVLLYRQHFKTTQFYRLSFSYRICLAMQSLLSHFNCFKNAAFDWSVYSLSSIWWANMKQAAQMCEAEEEGRGWGWKVVRCYRVGGDSHGQPSPLWSSLSDSSIQFFLWAKLG